MCICSVSEQPVASSAFNKHKLNNNKAIAENDTIYNFSPMVMSHITRTIQSKHWELIGLSRRSLDAPQVCIRRLQTVHNCIPWISHIIWVMSSSNTNMR